MLKNNFEIEVRKPEFPDREFNIKEFGGVAEGKFDNTEVFAEAISSCHQAGGGTIIVPEGKWFTGPIHFKSNVHLKLEAGAVISFSDNFEDYLPVVFTRWEGNECYNYSPLIYAANCENIAITGQGKLVGNGARWWPWKQTQHAAARELYDAEYNGIPVEDRIFGREEGLRPQFIQPINSKNILIEGITIVDGPMWTIHPVYCENTIIRDLKIITDGPNTDGINPDSCKNMLIEDCDFETGDDCIAIKSGINEDGRRVNRPTENLLIRNCKAKEGHGGVVIGSEMSGGVKNVHVHDCVFNGGERGVRLKSMRGRGGCVENLLFENIEINNLRDQGIILNMYYDATTVEPRSEMPPLFRNITVRNITGTNINQPIVLRGLPENKMKDITLENIDLSGTEGLTASNLDGLYLKDIKLKVKAEAQFEFKNVTDLNIENSSCQENK
ncbi:glycosyl hydrolase family 28 [Halanaerobium saccharolyticum]|uniref:Glycosyl hydrolase family 28 n=1 Tax=Halanaerobium saccharolyticum TaxID=43595 RepID=A0A4R7YZ51_9FIRM|nr:glycoside hydrolase family 28 protein [Halanaerobium saccharolyticum]RAK06876.1 glycosyl hydrolase family 28 [Halanaerobium saccharolyticum]TDW01486.1 glycosyl hydrolase family 28 [Halanaerobium saccharolyticum]TDX52847.1 glycosyl hydrolase family 28 [Halanaerobium saccharolyticum]